MNILTFDLEEWHHLLDIKLDLTEKQREHSILAAFTEDILEKLENKNTKATFFCLGESASKYPSIIKKIYDSGHDIGSHSYSHNLVYEQKKSDFIYDLSKSVNTLEKIIKDKVRFYRAPGFSIKSKKDLFYLEVLNDFGISVDSSIFPALRSHGGIFNLDISSPTVLNINEKFKIIELPISLFGLGRFKIPPLGGGYFRLLPEALISYLISKNNYNMSYLHPRDFITNQPKLSLPMFKSFKSYVGIKTASKKFDYIFAKHDFSSISQCLDSLDLDQLPEIKLNF